MRELILWSHKGPFEGDGNVLFADLDDGYMVYTFTKTHLRTGYFLYLKYALKKQK